MTFEILHIDPYLKPYESVLRRRYDMFQQFLKHFEEYEGLDVFTRSYQRMGLNVQPNGDIIYREWAPNAVFASLVGDFSELFSAQCLI